MTDGEQQQVGVIAGISQRLITALPAAYLIMLLLNLAFIGALFWLLQNQNASRERVLMPLLDSCSHTIPLEALKYFTPQQEPRP
jgi:hypothetical protein